MDEDELQNLLDGLITSWESEVVEFKAASKQFDLDKLGKYFSALANEANLSGADAGWLVFGIDNGSRAIVGTSFREAEGQLQSLKHEIASGAEPSSTFRDIHLLHTPRGRVLLFEIPPAPAGIPIAWKGHFYARNGESLTALDFNKVDKIRSQTARQDWTAAKVPGATHSDLDPEAIASAREAYIARMGARVDPEAIRLWPVETFTDRVGLTVNGSITRAALLLVGKYESAWRLSPHPSQITWSLEGSETAYEHFKPPFLLATTKLFQRIRNIQIKLLPPGHLVATEVSKYDQRVVLEALHNCIAHQDYTRDARIVVRELPDRLIFENEGSFFEGTPDEYVQGTKRPRRYRNPFLAQAMAELRMVDTLGYGIHQMNRAQAGRYLPLPTYDLTERDLVRLTIQGGVVDPKYTALLLTRTDLSFEDVLALDRVQKKLPVPDETVRRLRRTGLVEGRRPNLHVAASVAAVTASKADYIRTRAQDDLHYTRLIADYLGKFTSASRQDVNELLWDKLSDALDDQQKRHKITNLLTKMRTAGQIRNDGSRSKPRWRLV